jgi:hypothetical protein
MNVPFKVKEFGEELTLAQIWKAKKASVKLVKSDSKNPTMKKKEAA